MFGFPLKPPNTGLANRSDFLKPPKEGFGLPCKPPNGGLTKRIFSLKDSIAGSQLWAGPNGVLCARGLLRTRSDESGLGGALPSGS